MIIISLGNIHQLSKVDTEIFQVQQCQQSRHSNDKGEQNMDHGAAIREGLLFMLAVCMLKVNVAH